MLSRISLRTAPALCLLVIAGSACRVLAAPGFHPARYQGGTLPPLPPPAVVGGGEVMIELDVTSTGTVGGVRLLRTTPPYGDALAAAARAWRFSPAEMEKDPPPSSPAESRWRPVDSTVLVALIVRAPAYYAGPTLGDSPRKVGAAGDGTPVPLSTTPANYPPLARQAGMVLIETTIGADGRATQNRVLQSSPPFDRAALDALSGWRFRPARVAGLTAPVFAYVGFGFREPVAAQGIPSPTSNVPPPQPQPGR